MDNFYKMQSIGSSMPLAVSAGLLQKLAKPPLNPNRSISRSKRMSPSSAANRHNFSLFSAANTSKADDRDKKDGTDDFLTLGNEELMPTNSSIVDQNA